MNEEADMLAAQGPCCIPAVSSLVLTSQTGETKTTAQSAGADLAPDDTRPLGTGSTWQGES